MELKEIIEKLLLSNIAFSVTLPGCCDQCPLGAEPVISGYDHYLLDDPAEVYFICPLKTGKSEDRIVWGEDPDCEMEFDAYIRKALEYFVSSHSTM